MVYEQIENILGIKFNDSINVLIDQKTKIINFKANHTLLFEGDLASCLYIMLSGIVRGYYIDSQGNDITKCFYQKGNIFSHEGLQNNLPSPFTIECLGDSVCIKIPYDLLHEIMKIDNEIFHEIGKFYKKEVHKLENRNKDLVIKDAEERYRIFCNEYPDLHKKVPLKYIASYIGIRIPSLSRIRKKMKNIT